MENIVDFLKLEKPVVFWGVFALYAKTRNPRVETLTVTTRQLKCQQKCWVECLTVIRVSTVITVIGICSILLDFFFIWKGPQLGPLGPDPHGPRFSAPNFHTRAFNWSCMDFWISGLGPRWGPWDPWGPWGPNRLWGRWPIPHKKKVELIRHRIHWQIAPRGGVNRMHVTSHYIRVKCLMF